MLAKSNGHLEAVSLPDTLPPVAVNSLRVSDRIKALILTGGDDTRYPSRSEALFAVQEALIDAGYDDETVASVVLSNPIGEKAREQGERWLEGEIGRARAKAQEGGDPPTVKLGLKTQGTADAAFNGLDSDGQPWTLPRVVDTFRKYLYLPDTALLELALAAVIANRAPGDPVWLLLVAPPGQGKTEIVTALGAAPDCRIVGTLTEGALLSGTSKKERAANAKGGLLREIGDFGILLPKDFTSVIAMNKEARSTVLAALREIYDGRWERAVGTDGGKTLSWEGKCGLIGGCTPAIDTAHAIVATLGERFVFVRARTDDRAMLARRAMAHAGGELQMRNTMKTAVGGLLQNIRVPTCAEPLSEDETIRLVALADFAAICRAPVIRDPYRREVEDAPGAEAPTRLAIVLRQLLGGALAIGCTRTRAWELVTRVALDSMPLARRNVLACLFENDRLATQAVAVTLGTPTVTARRALEDLACYNVVWRDTSGKSDEWSLSDWTKGILKKAIVSEFPVTIYSSTAVVAEAVVSEILGDIHTFNDTRHSSSKNFGNGDEPLGPERAPEDQSWHAV